MTFPRADQLASAYLEIPGLAWDNFVDELGCNVNEPLHQGVLGATVLGNGQGKKARLNLHGTVATVRAGLEAVRDEAADLIKHSDRSAVRQAAKTVIARVDHHLNLNPSLRKEA